jgi:hypothetical protein
LEEKVVLIMSNVELNLEYNTSRDTMVISEYGRNIQKMVDFLVTIEDRDKRTAFAKQIVEVMGRVTLEKDEIPVYQNKLWDHLYLMSGIDLDIDFPFGKPSLAEIMKKPAKLEYPQHRIKYKMYGANIQAMIKTAGLMEESEEKQELINIIANTMKKAYVAWNKSAVLDEVIFRHLSDLSKGIIELDSATTVLKPIHDIYSFQTKKNTSSKKNKKKKQKKKK